MVGSIGVPPFSGSTVGEIVNEFQTKKIEINKNISADIKDLMKCILKRNPDERYDINQVIQHQAIINNIETFSRPLSADEYKIMITNYLINCGKSVIRDMPDELKKLKEEISDTYSKQSNSEKTKNSIKIQNDYPLLIDKQAKDNNDFSTTNFFAEVLPKIQAKFDQPMYDKLPDNFFEFQHEHEIFKKPLNILQKIKPEASPLQTTYSADQKQVNSQKDKKSIESLNENRSQSKVKQIFRIEHSTSNNTRNQPQQTIVRSLFSNLAETKVVTHIQNPKAIGLTNDRNYEKKAENNSIFEIQYQESAYGSNRISDFTQNQTFNVENKSTWHSISMDNTNVAKIVTFINYPLHDETTTEISKRNIIVTSQPTENVNYFPYDVHDISKSTVFNNLEKMTNQVTSNQKSELDNPLHQTNTWFVSNNQNNTKSRERELSTNTRKSGAVRYVLKDGVLVAKSKKTHQGDSQRSSLLKEYRSNQALTTKVEIATHIRHTNKFTSDFKTSQGISVYPSEFLKSVSARLVKQPNLTFVNYNDAVNPRTNTANFNQMVEKSEVRINTFNPYSPEPTHDWVDARVLQLPEKKKEGSHKDLLKDHIRLKSASNYLIGQETPPLLGYIRKAN